MNTIVKCLVSILFLASVCSCNSQRQVNYSKTHSYGFQHDDHVYFLVDYQVWKRGGRFWFIMPVQLPSKIYLKRVYLYRYESDLKELVKLGIPRDEAMQSTNVRYTKFTKENGKIIFSYHAGYDGGIERLNDIFVWDTQTGKFVDTGVDNPVRDDHPLYQNYFSDYESLWQDDSGMISISTLKNEILQHLTNEDYDLPAEW